MTLLNVLHLLLAFLCHFFFLFGQIERILLFNSLGVHLNISIPDLHPKSKLWVINQIRRQHRMHFLYAMQINKNVGSKSISVNESMWNSQQARCLQPQPSRPPPTPASALQPMYPYLVVLAAQLMIGWGHSIGTNSPVLACSHPPRIFPQCRQVKTRIFWHDCFTCLTNKLMS